MTAKYTPGPWNTGNSLHESKNGQTWSAPVWSVNGPEWGKMAAEAIAPTREMARANTRLIAAAPELLALVRAYLTTYPLDVYADKSQAAIAKAEGL